MKLKTWIKAEVMAVRAMCEILLTQFGVHPEKTNIQELHEVPAHSFEENFKINISDITMRANGYPDNVPAIMVVYFRDDNRVFYFCNTEFIKTSTRYKSALMEYDIAIFVPNNPKLIMVFFYNPIALKIYRINNNLIFTPIKNFLKEKFAGLMGMNNG